MSANGADAYRVRRSRSMAAVQADAAIQPNEWYPGQRERDEGMGVRGLLARSAGKREVGIVSRKVTTERE